MGAFERCRLRTVVQIDSAFGLGEHIWRIGPGQQLFGPVRVPGPMAGAVAAMLPDLVTPDSSPSAVVEAIGVVDKAIGAIPRVSAEPELRTEKWAVIRSELPEEVADWWAVFVAEAGLRDTDAVRRLGGNWLNGSGPRSDRSRFRCGGTG